MMLLLLTIPLVSLLLGMALLFMSRSQSGRWLVAPAKVKSCVSLDADWDRAVILYRVGGRDIETELTAPYNFNLRAKVGASINVLVHCKELTKAKMPGTAGPLKIAGVFALSFGVIGLLFGLGSVNR